MIWSFIRCSHLLTCTGSVTREKRVAVFSWPAVCILVFLSHCAHQGEVAPLDLHRSCQTNSKPLWTSASQSLRQHIFTLILMIRSISVISVQAWVQQEGGHHHSTPEMNQRSTTYTMYPPCVFWDEHTTRHTWQAKVWQSDSQDEKHQKRFVTAPTQKPRQVYWHWLLETGDWGSTCTLHTGVTHTAVQSFGSRRCISALNSITTSLVRSWSMTLCDCYEWMRISQHVLKRFGIILVSGVHNAAWAHLTVSWFKDPKMWTMMLS